MDVMDFEVLPGPSLAELARTALASAATAEIDDARPPGDPVYPGRVPLRFRSGTGGMAARCYCPSPDPSLNTSCRRSGRR